MKLLSQVVWSEGMYLGPHHFQVQNRYLEDLIDFAVSGLSYEPYGFIAFALDEEALFNGTLSLLHARGVFPDGLSFDIPQSDPAPPARNIVDLFPPTRNEIEVFLAVPTLKPNGRNTGEAGAEAPGTRFTAEAQTVTDEVGGRDVQSVQLARKNLGLLLESEVSENTVRLPLARVVRDGTGHFVADHDYAPPCLQLTACEGLSKDILGLIETLEQKSAELASWQHVPGSTASVFSAREITNSWLLHSVNTSITTLRHLFFTKHGHPEEIFVELSRLGGALCTFGWESHPRDLPLYDHLQLSECFHKLILHIRKHLELILPSNCVQIPVKKADEFYYAGMISDERVLGKSRWILGVSSTIGEVEVISQTPRLVKICSWDFIRKLVSKAMPGLSLTHIPSPPAAISPKLDTQYFSVDRSGPCWDHIQQTKRLGIYVPGELKQPGVEVLVLLES